MTGPRRSVNGRRLRGSGRAGQNRGRQDTDSGIPEPGAQGIAGVVLGAGSSRRMGDQNKLLLEYGGEPMVTRAVRTSIESGLDPVLLVTGYDAPNVKAAVSGVGCRAVHNAAHLEGTHTSVQTGVRALAERGAGALVVILGDMPLVTAHMLRTLVARYRETGAPLVVSVYGDAIAPPILYARPLFDELLAMDARCGRAVVRAHEMEAARVEWSPHLLFDVDSPTDYAKVEAGRAPN